MASHWLADRVAPVSAVQLRLAHPADAAILAEMANDLNDHVGIRGRPFTPERIVADGFGSHPAFTALVAEIDGTVIGYASMRPTRARSSSTAASARPTRTCGSWASTASACAPSPPPLASLAPRRHEPPAARDHRVLAGCRRATAGTRRNTFAVTDSRRRPGPL
ncbi:MAG: hypothetical protein HYU51_17315 [Candidatus Rokubacteria bacterium]|nr:hypothetical protein [Candidatus Rokubacteria bacterium]